MRLAFLAFLTVLPLLEIAILVKFGQWAGVWITLAIVIGTAIAGVGILQRQGLTMLVRTQEAVMRGEPPVGAMIDGGMMVLAGSLLIMPGLITDTLGLLLLVPAVRHFAANRLVSGLFGAAEVHAEVYEADAGRPRRHDGRHEGRRGDDDGGPVIEGDFERLDERPVDPRNPPSGSKN